MNSVPKFQNDLYHRLQAAFSSFSISVLIFLALTGHKPFENKTSALNLITQIPIQVKIVNPNPSYDISIFSQEAASDNSVPPIPNKCFTVNGNAVSGTGICNDLLLNKSYYLFAEVYDTTNNQIVSFTNLKKLDLLSVSAVIEVEIPQLLPPTAYIPLPPQTNYGKISSAQEISAEINMPVTATIDGHPCGLGRTKYFPNSGINYVIDVFSEGSPAGGYGFGPGCGLPGKPIVFHINGLEMYPHDTWTAPGPKHTDLYLSLNGTPYPTVPAIPTDLPSNTPTPTPIIKHTVNWKTSDGTYFIANNFYLATNTYQGMRTNQTFYGIPDPNTTPQITSITNHNSNTTLNIKWRENGVNLEMNIVFFILYENFNQPTDQWYIQSWVVYFGDSHEPMYQMNLDPDQNGVSNRSISQPALFGSDESAPFNVNQYGLELYMERGEILPIFTCSIPNEPCYPSFETPTLSPQISLTPSPVPIIDFLSFLNLFRTYYSQPNPPLSVDLNNNGKTEIFDFNLFVGNYGR